MLVYVDGTTSNTGNLARTTNSVVVLVVVVFVVVVGFTMTITSSLVRAGAGE